MAKGGNEGKRALNVFVSVMMVTSGLLVLPFSEWAPFGTASATPSFGTGAAGFTDYQPPSTMGNDAAEPGIGVNWNTGKVFINSNADQLRVTFNDAVYPPTAFWEDKSAPFSIVNIDPVLFTDSVTGRTFAGGLDGTCSIIGFTSDDGNSWTPSADACAHGGWDHETVGGGPYAEPLRSIIEDSPIAYKHAVYYCSQVGLEPSPAFCSRSLNGGLTFEEVRPTWVRDCWAISGHIRVAPDGTVYLPSRNCGGKDGFGVSTDNTLNWNVRTIPGSTASGRFDPSIAPSYNADGSGNYWIYYGQAEANGAFIAVSKDRGVTFEDIGAGNGVTPTKWLNVGALTSPPVLRAEFAEVIAGDHDRAAFAFLGATQSAANLPGCAAAQNSLVWYMYVAMTYDGGVTWNVEKASEKIVQRGSIGDPDETCRNLLDFNDITVGADGRVLIGYADGCTSASCEGPSGTAGQSRSEKATITRQSSGRGLFAAFDTGSPLEADAGGPYSGGVGAQISFDGAATGGTSPYSFGWDFGDGNTGSGASPTHAYASSGTYTVTLTVTDAASTSDSVSTTATVSSTTSVPVVDIENPASGSTVHDTVAISGTAGHTGDPNGLTFAGLSSVTGTGTTATLSWSSASGGTPPYTYNVYTGPAGSVDLGSPIETTGSTGTTISGLVAGVEACFIVRVTDSAASSDTNTVEKCYLPTLTTETITFYYHGGEFTDAPDPAPDSAVMVKGTMSTTPGAAPKRAVTGGGLVGSSQQIGNVVSPDIDAYPLLFESGPLTGPLTIADGTTTITDNDGAPWTIANNVLLRDCIAGGIDGNYFADVYQVVGDTATLVLTNDAAEFSNTGVLSADPVEGDCVVHHLGYAEPSTASHTFPVGSKILVGIHPDFFAASFSATYKWDGPALYDSHLEFTGTYEPGSPPVQAMISDAVGDGHSPEADFVQVDAAATATDLVVAMNVDLLLTSPGDGFASSEFHEWDVVFTIGTTEYDYQVYTFGQVTGLWSFNDGADSTGTVDIDYANNRITVTIPWTEVGATAGQVLSDVHVQSYETPTGFLSSVVPDDRAPDVGGAALSVPASVSAPSTGDLVTGLNTLFLHGERVRSLSVPSIGDLGKSAPVLSFERPEGLAPSVFSESDGPVFIAFSAPFESDATIGDGEGSTIDGASLGVYISQRSTASMLDGLNAELNLVTNDGVLPLARSYSDDGPKAQGMPTLVNMPFEMGKAYSKTRQLGGFDVSRTDFAGFPATDENGDVLAHVGDRLEVRFWIDSPATTSPYAVYYDNNRFPSALRVPLSGLAPAEPPVPITATGANVLGADDPQELPPQYASLDLKGAAVSNTATDLVVTFTTYGFDPALPHPGSPAATWEYGFTLDGSELALWIESTGAQNPTFEAQSQCLGCLGATGWLTLQSGFPVTIDAASHTLTATVPLSAWSTAISGASLSPGDTLTTTFLQARMLVPGNGLPSVLPTMDYAPGGGPETTATQFVLAPANGNEYTIQGGPNPDTPPTISAFSGSPTSGSAPLAVDFNGSVVEGTNAIASVSLNFGDGSSPESITLSGGSFSGVSHTYTTSGSRTATLTVTDTEGLTDSATQGVNVGSKPAGVYVTVGSGAEERATDDSPDSATWHIDHDFSVYAPGTGLVITAVFFDGSSESAPDSVSVTVGESGTITITSPADGAYVDPGIVPISGTTPDSSGSGQSSGMWTLPFADDVDMDRVQDALEDELSQASASDVYSVKVLLDHPATALDAFKLGSRGHATYSYPIKVIDAVDLEGVPAWAVKGLLRHDGAIRVEWNPPAVLADGLSGQIIKARPSSTYADCVWGGAGCLGYTGKGVGYANFDAGAMGTHKAFEWGAFAPTGVSPSTSKRVATLDVWGQNTVGNHATATAGLAVGTGMATTEQPLYGSAPGASLVSVIALQEIGGATGNSVNVRTCQAVDAVIAAKATYNIRVASLSYGSLLPASTSDDACVDRAVDNGIVMVIASGNTVGIGSPGTAAKAITVGNQDDLRTVSRVDDTVCHGAFFEANGFGGACGVSGSVTASNQVGKPDLLAPGVCVSVAQATSTTAFNECGSGTSYSAPIVAGIVALMFEANPALTPTQVKSILRETSHVGDLPPTNTWVPGIGYGHVDAFLAVKAAKDLAGTTPLSVDAGGPYVGSPGVDVAMSPTISGGTLPYTYLWNFGDAQTSTQAAPSHAWASAGTYTVTLTVTDSAATPSIVSDSTTATISAGLLAAIGTPAADDVVSGSVPVSGTAFFPPSAGSALDLNAPLWTDTAGDGGAGGANIDHMDFVSGYAWGDDGPADTTFNVGARLASLPSDPRNAEYARYTLQFVYGDRQYYLLSRLSNIAGTNLPDGEFKERFVLYNRPWPIASTSLTYIADITGSWDRNTGLVTWNVPKDRIQDSSGNAVQPGELLTDFAGSTSLAAAGSGIVSIDSTSAPASATFTIGPSGGDPSVEVTFGSLGPVLATGTTSWSTSFDSTLVPDGSTTITAIAYDGLGHASPPATVVVTVSNGGGTDPSVSFTTPGAGATVSGSVLFSGTASAGTGGSSSMPQGVGGIELHGTNGAVPMRAQIETYAYRDVRSWRLEWGDGQIEAGVGAPSGLYNHLYLIPGTHEVRMLTEDHDGVLHLDDFTVIASSDPNGEPGPTKKTLYFHMADTSVPADGLIDEQWVNADPDDPEGNSDGAISSGGFSPDGVDEWPLSPAPSQTLYLTTGGVGVATLEYEGPADVQTRVVVDVLVDGELRATGSTTADFTGLAPTTVTFNVVVTTDWDGTIPAGADVRVVTKYQTATGGWVGAHGFDTTLWSLMLPFTTTSGGGGGGSTIEEVKYYPQNVVTTFNSGGCSNTAAGSMALTSPAGQAYLHTTKLANANCAQNSLTLKFLTDVLVDDLDISKDGDVEVVMGVSGYPCGDCALAPISIGAKVGTAADPTLVGSVEAVVGPSSPLEYPWMFTLTFTPAADVTIPAGSKLRLELEWDSSQGQGRYFGPPHAVYGGGDDLTQGPAYWSVTVPKKVAIPPPAQVTGLFAIPGPEEITLGWNVVSGATSYKIYRDGVSIQQQSAIGFTDTGLTDGQLYTYEVSAMGPGGEGLKSSPVSETPGPVEVDEKVDVTVRRTSDSVVVFGPSTATGVSAWSLSWDSTTVGDGDYVATAVYQMTDSSTVQAERAFSVDNVPDVVAPTVSLSADKASALTGETITYTAIVTGTSPTIEWAFGDGATASGGTSQTHSYASAGTYTTTVTVSNSAGSDADSVSVTVLVPKTVEVRILGSIDDWALATPTGPAGSWSSWAYDWDATGLRGTFTIEARYFDGTTMNDPTSISVTVDAAPTAALTATPGTAPTGMDVTLDASASTATTGGSLVEYSFDPGDGSGVVTGAGSSLVHSYAAPGTYTASVTVEDDLGRVSAPATIDVVAEDRAPTAAFTAPSTVLTLVSVAFDGSASSDPDDAIASYAWNFGDGGSGSGAATSHAYASKGTYTVTLTVTDGHDASGSVSKDIQVLNRLPSASLDVSPASALAGTERTLSAASSSDADGTIVEYRFDPGDGTGVVIGTASSIAHTYEVQGQYTASVVVVDNDGDTDLAEFLVTAANRAPVLGAIGNKAGPEGALITFTVTASDPDGDAVTLSASNLPAGSDFDTTTGVFSWTPTYNQAGTYVDAHFEASDGLTSDSEDILIAVWNVDQAPVIAAIAAQTVVERTQLVFWMHASDADGDTLTLSALGLPAGSMFTTTPANDSAYVAWTPGFGQSGSYVVTLRASDGNLTTAVAVGIVVEDFPDHEAPVTSAAITSGTQSPSGWYTTNAEVTLTPADAGGSGLKSTYYRYNGGNRIGYNPSTRINVPSEGTTVISYWSEDNNGNLEAEKTITVRIDRLAPTVTITSPTGVFGTDIATTEGGTVNFTISANDGSGSGIGQVRFFVDGVLVKVDTSAGPYYYNWNAGAATTGRHVLSVKVVDNVGILVEKSISVVKLT